MKYTRAYRAEHHYNGWHEHFRYSTECSERSNQSYGRHIGKADAGVLGHNAINCCL